MKNLAIGVGLLAALWAVYEVVKFLKDNKEKVDPTSDKNLAYQTANSVAQAVTGDKDATVGTSIYGAVDTVMGWLPFVDSDAEKAAAASRKQCELMYPAGSGKRPSGPNNPCAQILGPDWNAGTPSWYE